MKVFYSWQSDTPRQVGKDFIRQALDIAVSSLEIDEADRPEVDQDTLGVLGSPPIAETILRKIRAADIIAADVTLTGTTPSGKRLINSNVAIEFGYAMGAHGDEVLIPIMNTYYGPQDDLPFDLKHRRWPVRFSLASDATNPERQRALDRLVSELRDILARYIDARRPPPEYFSPSPTTIDRSSYWKSDEVLAKFGDERLGDKLILMKYEPGVPSIYLHVWPHEKIAPLTAELLNDYSKSVLEPLCRTPSGYSHDRNRYGRIACGFDLNNRLLASTQVFRSGEIWGVNRYLLLPRAGLPNLIPMPALEQDLEHSLGIYLRSALANFGYPEMIHVRFGLVNISGYKLAMKGGELSDEIFEDVEVLAEINGRPSSVGVALQTIFLSVREAAGVVGS